MSLYIYLSVLSVVFLISLKYWRSLIKSDLQYLFWLVIITFIVEAVGTYYIRIIGTSHPWIFKVYTIFEYGLISLYFLRIHKNIFLRKLIYISMLIPVVTMALLLLYPDRFVMLNKYKFMMIALLIVSWSIMYFRNLLKSNVELNLKNDPHFYVNTGFLLFFGGSFFLMGLIFYIKERDINLARNLYSINHVLNIFYYSLLAYGFICHSKSMKS